MKQAVFPRMIALLTISMTASLPAQNLVNHLNSSEYSNDPYGTQRRFAVVSALPGSYEVPAIQRAQGELSNDRSVITAQDPTTLDSKENTSRNVDTVVNLDMLRNPSAYRKIQVSAKGQPYEIDENSFQSGLARISAAYRESGKAEKSSDCHSIALSVEQQIKLNPSQILEIVEREIAANPACSCEVVKTAITVSEANVDQVVAIVDVAIHTSPESMRMISQCAIAAMPEAIAGVQALLARLDPNAGESGYSSKSAKSGKEANVAAMAAPVIPNPLDLPPPLLLPPPPVFPRLVTNVNP